MSDLFAIEGQHVLVTGASSGFGRHFALFLVGRGARVTVAARRAEAIDKTVQTIQADKGQGQGVVMDVTSTGSIDVALAAAEQGFGPVDVLINNAGVASTKAALEQAEADWDKVIDTNLKGSGSVATPSADGWPNLKREGQSSTSPRFWAYALQAPSRPTPSRRPGWCR